MDFEHTDEPLVEELLAEVAWVRTLARRLVRDEASADDVAQGAWAAALEREPAVGRSLRPWFARVVGRLARHRRRADARRLQRETGAALERASVAPGSDQLLARLERQEELARAVRALPDPYRTVILRRFYEDQSAAEIARATHTTAATVRSQLARGLERLRASLPSEHRDDRGGLRSFLILAAGSDAGWLPRLAAETIAMQTGTKIAIGAAVAAATIFTAARWEGSSGMSLYPEGEARSLDGRPVAPPTDLPQEGAAMPEVVLGTRTAAAVEPDTATRPKESLAAAPAPNESTRISALIVDDRMTPLAGATILAVRADGRPRGSTPSPATGADGRTTLALQDSELRASGHEVFAMMFAVRAEGRATQFVEVTPKLHGETDLGRVMLEPGGGFIGTAVDARGAPLVGAVVIAAEPVVVGRLETLRLQGPNLDITRPRALSDEAGRFRVDGLPLGEARLWLHSDGCLWTIDGARTVVAGRALEVGQIVVEPAPRELSITGRVRTPAGADAGGAHVWFQRASDFDDERVVADAEGRFVLVPKAAGAFELLARDARGELAPSATTTASLGAEDIVLELRPRRVIAVHVTDQDGRPVEGAALAPLVDLDAGFFVGGGRILPGEDWTRTDVDGRAELFVPPVTFKLTASKRGFEGQRLGPYEPEQAPSALEVMLEREPAIEGRVHCAGVPVPKARIQIGERKDEFIPLRGAFPMRFYVAENHGIVTDAEGRFFCPVPAEWLDVTVFAVSDSHAVGELELHLKPGKGAQGVELEVTRGGVLTGTVVPPAGELAEGLVVVASRGDGEPVWARADVDGRYRLERLAPGPWHVEGRLEPPSFEIRSFASSPEEMDFRWNVEVGDGETTEFDVDMRGLGDVVVDGRVTIDGVPAAGWSVELQSMANVLQRKALPSTALAPDGSFVLVAPAATYYLRLRGPLESTEGAEVVRVVELVGPRFDWTHDIETAWFDEAFPVGTLAVKFTGGHYIKGDDSHAIQVGLDSERRVHARLPKGRWGLQTLLQKNGATQWQWVRSFQH